MKPAARILEPIAHLMRGALALSFIGTSLALPAVAHAKDNNAVEALEEFKGKAPVRNPIENRFFVKANRFEIAPSLGYVPNNSFAEIYIGGAYLAYHFSDTFAVEAAVLYSPNTGNDGVKNLSRTLLDIAYQGDPKTTFQQPIDRLQLATAFSARWAPVYGKINLVGEGVANFDVYGTGGLGLLLITKDVAVVSEEYKNGVEGADPVALVPDPPTQPSPALNLGFGMNFFISSSIALKLDARTLIFVGPEADYGNIDPQTGQPEALQDELQSVFITTGGISIFVPKMKPRLFNF